MQGNLFVVSRLGQIRNVQAFIREYGATDNHLAVLYTTANMSLPNSINKHIDPELFGEIVRIRQPERPLSQSRKKNRIIYGQIEKLLLKMVNEAGVENLFLCNTDNYYGFFETVIEEKRLSLTTVLLEEGLQTYATAAEKKYTKSTKAAWSDVRARAQHALQAGLRALNSLARLIATFLSWALRIDLIRLIQEVKGGYLIDRKHRYRTITHFDRAFVYFPDKMHTNNIQIGQIERLEFPLEVTAPQAALDSIEDDSVVFISQRYINYNQYFRIVFQVLGEMGVKKVYFKFHPREVMSSFSHAWEQSRQEYPGLEVLYPEEIQPIPVEELMAAGKVKQVVGLTSTSLMYGSAFFPGVDVVSIGVRFKQLAESDAYQVSRGGIAEFNRDLEAFLDVSDVPQF